VICSWPASKVVKTSNAVCLGKAGMQTAVQPWQCVVLCCDSQRISDVPELSDLAKLFASK